MNSIIYIGMDVHTTNYTLAAYDICDQKTFAQIQVEPDYLNILKYIQGLNKRHSENTEFICGYEAGYLGYSLYHNLTNAGVKCVIMAPSTMPALNGKRIKTDKRDAVNISKCLAYGTYSAVHVPSKQDEAVKEFIRMRDDQASVVKKHKQQILAFCGRHNKVFEKSSWTNAHISWLKSLKFDHSILNETFQEYLAMYFMATERLERLDKRIVELSQSDTYKEDVSKLICFSGIKHHTALSLRVEISDFNRFPDANSFASFLGLVPGERSSSDSVHRGGITKAGNSHLRRLIIESVQGYNRGAVGYKSKLLKARQAGAPQEIVSYADRALIRLKKKYYRLQTRTKSNVAKVAVARELACFIWGMMTGNVA